MRGRRFPAGACCSHIAAHGPAPCTNTNTNTNTNTTNTTNTTSLQSNLVKQLAKLVKVRYVEDITRTTRVGGWPRGGGRLGAAR
jgi:hypothetical protein